MKQDMSKVKKLLTPQEAHAKFRRAGKSVQAWAHENGFCDQLVYKILGGHRRCHRGQSHKIAVLLGIKDGVIED